MNPSTPYIPIFRKELTPTNFNNEIKPLKQSHYIKRPYQHENIQQSHRLTNDWIETTSVQSRLSQKFIQSRLSSIKPSYETSLMFSRQNTKQLGVGNERNNFKDKIIQQIDRLKQKSARLQEARKGKNTSRVITEKSFYQKSDRTHKPKTQRTSEDCTLNSISSRILNSQILYTDRSIRQKIKLNQLSQRQLWADNNLTAFLNDKLDTHQTKNRQSFLSSLTNPEQFGY